MTVQVAASRMAARRLAVRDVAVGLTVAAACFGAAEVLLQRIAAPLSAHVALPGDARLQLWGDFAAGATAALVITASAALTIALRRPLLAGVVATTLVALAAPEARPALYAAVVLAIASSMLLPPRMRGESLGGARVRGASAGAPATALAAAAIAVAAGLWPLVFSSGVAEARTVAEVALVAAPVLAAIWVVGTRRTGAGAWLAAAAVGGLAGIALTVRLDTTAMAATWALGITLALPAAAYVAAAAAAGLVVATWAADPARRLRLAGVALLAVAGLQPAAVHHCLTAVLAVVLLSLPAGALDEGAAR